MRSARLAPVMVAFALAWLVAGLPSTPASAGPAVDLTGEWGFVYAQDSTIFGECTAELSQSGTTLTNIGTVECDVNGSVTATGGVMKSSSAVVGLDVTFEINYPGPPVSFTSNNTGTVSPDGMTQQGSYIIKPFTTVTGTYVGRRMTVTCPSPPCSDLTISEPEAGASVRFELVTATGGTTVIRSSSSAGTLPPQFEVLGEYYHAITRATYAGEISVCVSYDDADNDGVVDGTAPPVEEDDLRLLHNEGGVFVNRTDAGKSDVVANEVCAVVSDLSEFALGSGPEPTVTPTPSLTPTLTATPTATPPPPVGGVSLDDGLALPAAGSGPATVLWLAAGVIGSIVALGGVWYAGRRWQR